MGRQHLRRDDEMQVIDLRQSKTGTSVPIPVMADELQALAALPPGQLSFLVNRYGASYGATAPTGCVMRSAASSPTRAAMTKRSPTSRAI
jgi:hypothetical protein